MKKRVLYKTIIPSLVSFEASLKKIRGFYYSYDLSLFKESPQKSTFHYKVSLDSDFVVPKDYDFRSGYYFKKGSLWYFSKRLPYFSLRCKYDYKNKAFSFNKSYLFLPIEMGSSIFPVGRLIADFVNLDLFLDGFITFHGCAVCYKGVTVCIVAPSFNGKTSLLRSLLNKGGKYIADNFLILDYTENIVYSSGPSPHLFAKETNRKFQDLLQKDRVSLSPKRVDHFYLVQNVTSAASVVKDKDLFEYLNLNGLYFLKNAFVQAYIFEENLTRLVYKRIESLRTCKFTCKFVDLKNFAYEELFSSPV